MNLLLRPAPLRLGATLAIYSPSYPGAALFPQRLSRGVKALECLGFQVQIPEAALKQHGYTAGTAEERASELMRLFKDDTIDGIICSIGGFNSNEILPLLDYSIISKHPKVFVGYSDVTSLLLGLYTQTKLVTFHGPVVLPEWGEYPKPLSYTVTCFRDVTGDSTGLVKYSPPTEWTNEFLDWSKEESNRPRRMHPNEGWKIVKEGMAEGRLIGGNIETLNLLLGTPYFPDFSEVVLFLEATEAEAYLPRFHRALTQLRLCGVLQKIKALIVGKCPDTHPEKGVNLESLIHMITEDLDIPVLLNVDIGHTDPKLTLPIGVKVRLTCRKTNIIFELLQPAVQSEVNRKRENS